MSTFWLLLELQFFGLKMIVFYPQYRKTIFSEIISVKNTDNKSSIFGKIKGLAPFENVNF